MRRRTMIFVSAGHYPARPGARYRDVTEHAEAVRWADALCAALGDEATRVPNDTLREKVRFINHRAEDVDLAVEIHFNSFRIWEDLNRDGLCTEDELRAAGQGCETLYYPGSVAGHMLATACQEAIAQVFWPDRGVKEGWYRMNPRNGPDFFLAQTRCAAAILEPEFIHRIAEIEAGRDKAVALLAEVLRGHGGT